MEGGGGGGGGAAGVAVGPRAMFWRHGGLQRGYPLTWPAAISPSKYSNMQMIAQLFSSRRRLAPGISGFSCPQPGILAQDARNDSGASPPGGERGRKGEEMATLNESGGRRCGLDVRAEKSRRATVEPERSLCPPPPATTTQIRSLK